MKTTIYYVAIQNGDDVIYIYRPTEPKIGEKIYYNYKMWVVKGYMPTECGRDAIND